MSSVVLLYDAKIHSSSCIANMCVAGICFGIINGEVIDGDNHLADFVRTAWFDSQGIGFLTVSGNEYLILGLDSREPVNRNRQQTSELFALAFLGKMKEL